MMNIKNIERILKLKTTLIVLNMKEKFSMINEMEKEFIDIQMEIFIWEIGKMINFMERVIIFFKTEKGMKGN